MDAKQHAAAAFSNAQQAAQQLANFLAPGELQGKGRCLDDCAKYVGLAQSHAHAAEQAEQADQQPQFPVNFEPLAQPQSQDLTQDEDFGGYDPHAPPSAPKAVIVRPTKAPAAGAKAKPVIVLKDHPEGSWRGGLAGRSRSPVMRAGPPPPPPPPPA